MFRTYHNHLSITYRLQDLLIGVHLHSELDLEGQSHIFSHGGGNYVDVHTKN